MSLAVIEQPSEVFDGITETLLARIAGITVGNYDEFNGVTGDAMVLIEFEQSSPAKHSNDGRPGSRYRITLHGVVAKHRRRAPLEAVNLTSALQRVVAAKAAHRWGFNHRAIGVPENVSSAPSMFAGGEHGYEAWGVSFEQVIYVGEPLADPEATPLGVPGMPMIVWNANDPDDPRNIDSTDDYRPVSCAP
jgi:hypothetical protein